MNVVRISQVIAKEQDEDTTNLTSLLHHTDLIRAAMPSIPHPSNPHEKGSAQPPFAAANVQKRSRFK